MRTLMITLCLMTALSAQAQTVPQQLRDAFYRNDVVTLRQMLNEDQLSGSDWKSLYYRAFAHVHIGRVTMFLDGDAALEHLQKAETLIEEILSIRDNEFEVWILMVSAKGLMVGASGGSRFWKGLQAGSTLKKAAKLAPNHPKVRFEKAIGLIFAPSWYGKDLNKAAALLLQNLDGELSNPDWVPNVRIEADHHAWLAFIALEQKNAGKALYHINQSLRFRSDYDFILSELKAKYAQLTGADS